MQPALSDCAEQDIQGSQATSGLLVSDARCAPHFLRLTLIPSCAIALRVSAAFKDALRNGAGPALSGCAHIFSGALGAATCSWNPLFQGLVIAPPVGAGVPGKCTDGGSANIHCDPACASAICGNAALCGRRQKDGCDRQKHPCLAAHWTLRSSLVVGIECIIRLNLKTLGV